MSPHRFAAFWNRGEAHAPHVTGAVSVMDCADLRDACEGLGLELPLVDVLDVGCGTGRFAQCCTGYVGVDIAQDQIAYAARQGLNVAVINGPGDLSVLAPATWVTCLSVFTHIDREERRAYLEAFAHLAQRLLVDIIPGDGAGDVALWTADWSEFVADLGEAGWRVESGPYDRTSPDGVTHRYVAAVRRIEAARSRRGKKG